jgi:CDP-diacylglycerol--glycerol-3-phosphate 3-phosphatidyltransferase
MDQPTKPTFTRAIGVTCNKIIVLIVRVLAISRIHPNMLTLIGLLINIVAAVLLAQGNFWAGGWVITGAAIFDMVDGRVARETNQVTRFGGFFDSVLDRYSDLALLMGLLVYYGSINRPWYVVLTAVVMTASVMISYTRARAENTIPRCKVGFMERPERIVLIMIATLFNRVPAVLWVIAVLGNLTVIHRMIYTYQESKRLEDAQLRAGQRNGQRRIEVALALENHEGHPVLSSVRHRQVRTLDSRGRRDFSGAAVECQRGPARGQVGHFEVAKRDALAPARSNSFHARFLGRETRGVALVAVGLGFDISDFARRENAIEESRAVALNRRANARHFAQVHSGAEDHSPPAVVTVNFPCLTPLVAISELAMWRTVDAFPRTTSTSRQWSWSR